jgi:hypothetical protein
MARVGAAAGIVAIALLGLHALSVKADDVQSVANVASSSVDKTLVQTPWFPRADYLRRYIDWQPVPWILIAVGTAIALARRRFDVASMSLSLLPLAFYRNAFPYYFVVMLAPASVLAGWAFAELAAMTRRHASEWVASSLVAVLWLGSVFNGVRYFDRLNFDEQAQQREVLVGIHQIFPEPVAYIDRCGMVSSFTKANFFMSSWGFDAYSARGAPVMRSILAAQQPAFVLVNVPALSPTHSAQPALLPEDQEVLAKHYVSYWGPVRVAGADVALAGTSAQRVTVPFAAKYRVITAEPVMIDDRVRVDGDIIEVPERGVDMARTDETAGEPVQVRLVVATAQLPPAAEPIGFPLFKNL